MAAAGETAKRQMTAAQTEAVRRFVVKSGGRFNQQDADILGPILARFTGCSDAEVLQEASNPKSPLHPYFQWDDSLAGHHYRMLQVQHMRQTISIEVIGSKGEIRQVAVMQKISVRTIDPEDTRKNDNGKPLRVWIPIETIQTNDAMAQELMDRCYRQVKSMRDRLADYRSILSEKAAWVDLFSALDKLIEEEAAD